MPENAGGSRPTQTLNYSESKQMKFRNSYPLTASVLVCALVLTGCNQDDDAGDSVTPLSVDSVNQMIASNAYIGSSNVMSCKQNTNPLGGCFQHPACDKSSDYFSTRMVYSLEPGMIKAFTISYQSPDCSGAAHAHPTVWSKWNIQLSNSNLQAGTADAALTLVRYEDGYLFDSNKPNMNTTYRAAIKVDRSSGSRKLCLSTPLIDPDRPLKFMDTTAKPLDEANCAIGLD